MVEERDILIENAAYLIAQARKVVVFTGAGVSTESGIPDFRSPGGIWDEYDPEEFTYQKFLSSPEERKKHWQMFRKTFLSYNAEPNPAHYAIAELEKMGKLDCVITQNVDDLHQRAGVPRPKVFELHGNMHWAKCLSCNQRYPMEELKKRLDGGETEVPVCDTCSGIVKPEGVFFGEQLPEQVLREATRRICSCDLLIVVGSSLVVYPAASLPFYALHTGAKLIVINLAPTPLDRYAAVILREKAGEVMPQITERLKFLTLTFPKVLEA